jgi:predicted alpha/beta superfamily hydrolase
VNLSKDACLSSKGVFLLHGRFHHCRLNLIIAICLGLGVTCVPQTIIGQEPQSNKNVKVKFRVHLPEPLAEGESVFLSGNHPAIGNWKPEGLRLIADPDGHYWAQIEVPLSTNLQFKLTRGSWSTVESEPNGGDRPNRTLVVDRPKTDELFVRGWSDKTRGGPRRSIVVGDLKVWHETSIDPSRSIRVWLPPSHGQLDDSGLQRRFPVLYLLDGQNLFDSATSAFGIEWGIDESLMHGILTGEIAEMIVVGVDNTAQRIEEYTNQKFEIGGKVRGGNANVFIDWLSGALKKKIDQKFYTLPERESTWIGGSSLGGLCTLHAVLTHEHIFSKGLIFSPSVFWAEAQLTEDTVTQITKISKPVKLWIDFGDSEGNDPINAKKNLDRFIDFRSAVSEACGSDKTAPVQVSFSIVPGGKHTEASWGKRFLVGLKAIAN